MPILAAEPALFPETLFEATSADFPERRWRVLHTRARQEKSLARHLFEKDIAFYLPLLAKRVRVRQQIVKSHRPLFAGYLFLLGNKDEQLAALSTGRVANALEVNDQDRLWQDLRQIHRLIESGRSVIPEERFTPGTPVEIREGPLTGLRGMIVKSVSGHRFVVTVDFIQRGASVLLDDAVLDVCVSDTTCRD